MSTGRAFKSPSAFLSCPVCPHVKIICLIFISVTLLLWTQGYEFKLFWGVAPKITHCLRSLHSYLIWAEASKAAEQVDSQITPLCGIYYTDWHELELNRHLHVLFVSLGAGFCCCWGFVCGFVWCGFGGGGGIVCLFLM